MDKNNNKIKGYLSVPSQFEVKRFLIGMLGLLNIFNPLIFNFLNDLGLEQSLKQPQNVIFLIITIIFDCWGICILMDITKRKNKFILFSGVISIFLSILYISVFYEIVYLILDIKSLIYILLAILVAFLIVLFNLLFLKYAVDKNFFSKERNRKVVGSSFALLLVSIGMIGEKLYRKFSDERSQLVTISIAILLFGYCFLFTIHNVYKYYLVKNSQVIN